MILSLETDIYFQIITTYIVPVIGLIIMIIMAVKKWRQSKDNPYNVVISLFFLSIIVGILMNVGYGIYVNSDPPIAFFFAWLSALFLNYSVIFPLFFLIALEKSFVVMKKKHIALYFLVFTVFIIPILFIGDVFLAENFILRWNLTLAIYSFSYSLISFIFIMIYSARLMKKFEKQEIKRRFIAFIVGFFVIMFMLVFVVLVKLGILTPVYSSISMVIGLIAAPLLIYYGIERKK